MKRIFSVFVIAFVGFALAQAQPQKSRVQKNANANKTNAVSTAGVSRADLMFPTAVDVPEEPIWRRDIYRELDLTKDENAALYYPVQPQGKDMNLFTLLFTLLNQGKIPAYKHDLNTGKEDFSQTNRLHFKEMCENYSIYYEVNGNTIKVEPSDIPSADVKTFYVKESSYYDQYTATYHSRIVALCPLIEMSNDFSFSASKSPMFWVKYDDIKTYLSNHMVMVSNVNNAAKMSMEDFFSTNHYKGDIYMTTNMQGKSLAQMVAADTTKSEIRVDSTMIKAQNKIEKEMKDFEEHIWKEPVDSVAQAKKDSIAAAEADAKKLKTKANRPNAASVRGSSSTKSTAPKKEKTKKEKSGANAGTGTARVSARRQRH